MRKHTFLTTVSLLVFVVTSLVAKEYFVSEKSDITYSLSDRIVEQEQVVKIDTAMDSLETVLTQSIEALELLENNFPESSDDLSEDENLSKIYTIWKKTFGITNKAMFNKTISELKLRYQKLLNTFSETGEVEIVDGGAKSCSTRSSELVKIAFVKKAVDQSGKQFQVDQDENLIASTEEKMIFNVCDGFFKLNINKQIGTLIHEAAHLVFDAKDHRYEHEKKVVSVRDNFNNADTYAVFSREIYKYSLSNPLS